MMFVVRLVPRHSPQSRLLLWLFAGALTTLACSIPSEVVSTGADAGGGTDTGTDSAVSDSGSDVAVPDSGFDSGADSGTDAGPPPADFYVDPSQPPGGDGSAGAPFSDVFTGLAQCTGTRTSIFLFPGTYPPITLPPNCVLIGSGRGVTVFDGAGTDRPITVPDGGAPGAELVSLDVVDGDGLDGGCVNVTGGNLHLMSVGLLSCTAGDGGGLWGENATVMLIDVEVANSNASDRGGGVHLRSATLSLTDLVLDSNTASSDGGGLFLENCTVTSIGGLCTGNLANRGGCMYVRSGSVATFEGLMMMGNTAIDTGGGFRTQNTGTSLQIINSVIALNDASGGAAGRFEGGVGHSLRHVTVVGNTATSGIGGIDCAGSATIVSSILWGNVGTTTPGGHAGCTVSYSDVQDDPGMDMTNISVDPMFVGVTDYHLLPTSLCVDSGDPALAPAVDLDGTPRVDGMPDMGAYER